MNTQHLGSPGSGSLTRRRTALNLTLMWTLLAICAVSPLPLGSNRPFFWSMTACIVGSAAMFYGLAMWRLRADFRVGLGSLRAISILFLMLIGYLAFQLLPLGFVLGSVAGDGDVAAGLVPRAISIAPGATTLMLLRMLTYGLFFFLVLQVAGDSGRRSLMLDVLLLVITGYALVGMASLHLGDTILGMTKWTHEGSATGTFVNRNSFATFLAFGTILALVQILDFLFRSQEERAHGGSRLPVMRALIYSVALIIIFSALLATQSRMGFTVAAAGGSFAILVGVARSRRGALPAILLALLLIGGGTTFLIYGGGLLERFDTLDVSGEQRLELYKQVIQLIALRPWTGFGGGAFELAFPLVQEPPVSPGLVWDKAHNTYLTLWSELGLLFGSIPIVIIVLIGTRLMFALFARRGSWRAQVLALGVILVGGLHSLVDFSLEIQANTVLFLALLAIGWAASPKSAAN